MLDLTLPVAAYVHLLFFLEVRHALLPHKRELRDEPNERLCGRLRTYSIRSYLESSLETLSKTLLEP